LLISDATEMFQQVQEAVRNGDLAKHPKLISTLSLFLRKIPDRKEAKNFKTLSGLVGMYVSLGDTIADDNAKQAKEFYNQAAKLIEVILTREKAEPGFVPKERMPLLQRQQGKIYRGAGEYEKAITAFAAILKAQPGALSVQIDAAETYQAMGATNPDGYVHAIKGVVAKGVWGWAKLGKDTAQNPKYRESFHIARYNLSVCRKLFAATIKDPQVKEKTLKDAKRDIQQTYNHDPELGGQANKQKTDVLLRELQKELGEQVIGLQEFAQPAANPANPPANPPGK
jgi:tetratricopeptide (TPR) repeat protein